MIPETENPQETKSVCPGSPARHALRLIQVDSLRRVHNVCFRAARLTCGVVLSQSVSANCLTPTWLAHIFTTSEI